MNTPIFIDWADFRMWHEHYTPIPWPQPGDQTLRCWPIVGELMNDLSSGHTRRRKFCSSGKHGQRLYWTPDDPVAFASMPGGWWSATAEERGDNDGWETLVDWDSSDEFRCTLQRIDIAWHVEGVDDVFCNSMAKVTEYKVDGKFTGWTIGSQDGGWLLRVYRKDVYDPGDSCELRFPGLRFSHPWRIELQLRAKYLKSYRIEGLAGVQDATALQCWQRQTVGSHLFEFLDRRQIQLWHKGNQLYPPSDSHHWERQRPAVLGEWETLAKQARGCYIQGVLTRLGLPAVPRESRQAVALDCLPDLAELIRTFEDDLLVMVQQSKDRP